LVFKLEGSTLIIGIKEENKDFSELSDTITITNTFNLANQIENFSFSNGEILSFNDLEQYGAFDDDNVIIGTNGNDELHGGKGNDTLNGSSGNDTYIFNLGDGQDIINNNNGNDTLKFGDGITSDSLIFQVDGADLKIGIKEENKDFSELSNTITITNAFNLTNQIENFSFSNGEVLSFEEITQQYSLLDGDNVITGNYGNDELYGGKGNDTLNGANGDDTYIFNLGDGKDIISDAYYGGQSNGNDTLKFGDGITADDLIFKSEALTLIIGLKEENKDFSELSDTITINNAFNLANQIENFSFSNGEVLSFNDLKQYGAFDGDNVITGTTGNDELHGGKGNDTLNGNYGDDTYIFKLGDGKDIISDGYYGNRSNGNDTLKFGDGITSDSLIFQVEGADLKIGIKEENKDFSELSDTITITSTFNLANHIENFSFSNGEVLSFEEITQQYGLLDGDNVITGTDGNDVLYGGKGNDNLNGSYGDDTYIFNVGDGRDIISDAYYSNLSNGNDILRFGEGISKEDLIIKTQGNDLVVALKEDGIEFENLTNKITITDWYSVNNRIENFTFVDDADASMDVSEIMSLSELLNSPPLFHQFKQKSLM